MIFVLFISSLFKRPQTAVYGARRRSRHGAWLIEWVETQDFALISGRACRGGWWFPGNISVFGPRPSVAKDEGTRRTGGTEPALRNPSEAGVVRRRVLSGFFWILSGSFRFFPNVLGRYF